MGAATVELKTILLNHSILNLLLSVISSDPCSHLQAYLLTLILFILSNVILLFYYLV